MNIVIVGAKDYNNNFNNSLQAAHQDLINLKNKYNDIIITCYDILYDKCNIVDDIIYKKTIFEIGDVNVLEKNKLNIVIEFCNLFNEYYLNHGEIGDLLYNQLLNYKEYNLSFLNCGCSWNAGFPIACIDNIIKYKYYTPCDALDVNNLLVTVSTISEINNNNLLPYMQSYIMGLYQIMGSLLWRNTVTQEVLRKLFTMIDLDFLNSEEKKDFESFFNKEKIWNNLKWSTRDKCNNFIYSYNLITVG
jgi:hypothetical protein